jgi:purine-binding chemotaxis protein CheW
MDIAKIRKKLKKKEADSQRSSTNGQTSEEHETPDLKPDEKNSEQIIAEADIIHETDSRKDEKPKAESTEVDKNILKEQGVEGKIEEDKKDDVIEILIFNLLKEEYAFKISQLEEIRRYQVITMVPKMPNYVMGITSLRGKVIPVIDLKTRLLLKDIPSDIDYKVKILIIKGSKGPIGVVVDSVIGVARISKTEILPPPSHLTETELKFIEGIAVIDKRFISIIHLEEALNIND